MLGLTAPQVMLMEALELVLLGKTMVEKLEMKVAMVEELEMKVEFENFLLCLFPLKGKVMLVLLCPPLQLQMELMRAVMRALRGQEAW